MRDFIPQENPPRRSRSRSRPNQLRTIEPPQSRLLRELDQPPQARLLRELDEQDRNRELRNIEHENALLFEPSRQVIMVSQPADDMQSFPARLADSDAAPQSPAEVQVHQEDTAVAESRYLGTDSDTPILPSGDGNSTRVDVSIQPLQREHPLPPLTSHECFFRLHFLSMQYRSIPVTGPTSYACSSCRIKLDVESLCICRRCIAACHDYCLLDGVCGYCRPRVDDE